MQGAGACAQFRRYAPSLPFPTAHSGDFGGIIGSVDVGLWGEGVDAGDGVGVWGGEE